MATNGGNVRFKPVGDGYEDVLGFFGVLIARNEAVVYFRQLSASGYLPHHRAMGRTYISTWL
jgi:hypothetical protein